MADHLRYLAAKLAAHRLFAMAAPDPTGWGMLRDMGVPLDDVAHVHAPIVRTLATFEDDHFRMDDSFGEVAFATCIHDEDAESVMDVVAWSARDPDIFGTLLGSPLLGIDVLLNPASYVGKPCMLHSTPLAWFKASCTGAAILDLPGARTALQRAPGPFTAATIDEAEGLLRSGIVPGSRLMVPAEWGRAA